MKKVLLTFLISIVIVTFPNPAIIQAEEEEIEMEENVEEEVMNMGYVYGDVSSVNPAKREIAVKEEDYDTGEEEVIVFIVEDSTKIENTESLQKIKKGDFVFIEYITKADGQKVAQSISVDEEEVKYPEYVPDDREDFETTE